MGMGRIPGNLPIELIADYLNDYADKNYDIDYMMDAIQDYIAPIKGEVHWGYTPAYFLSAKFNLHRNYAEHYLKKGDLTNRDINHILSRFDAKKATVFDAEYADALYAEYNNNRIQDTEDRARLSAELTQKNILIVAPGRSILEYHDKILNYIEQERPLVIAVNFIPQDILVDYAFFSNNKRFDKIEVITCKIIATSNIAGKDVDYRIDYNSVSGAFDQGCNSLIMLLKLLKELEAGEIMIAGADGYTLGGINYCSKNLRNYTAHDNNFNIAVSEAIDNLGIVPKFLTPSAYDN